MSDTSTLRRALIWLGFAEPSAEVHGFTAELQIESRGDVERLLFAMSEPYAH